MLAHDKKIRLAIEPKPNEPMTTLSATIGHALAIAQLTRDPNESLLIGIGPRYPGRIGSR